jgi:hypothetical protein
MRLPELSTQTLVLLPVCHSVSEPLSELQPADASMAAEIAVVSGRLNFFILMTAGQAISRVVRGGG